MTANVTIGGAVYELAPLTFKRMRLVWPLLSKHVAAQAKVDPEKPVTLDDVISAEYEATADAIKIIAIAITDKRMTSDVIEEELLASEMPGIRDAISDVLVESGLIERGKMTLEVEKILAQLQQNLSTGTSTELFPGLSPQASKAEAGTPSTPNGGSTDTKD